MKRKTPLVSKPRARAKANAKRGAEASERYRRNTGTPKVEKHGIGWENTRRVIWERCGGRCEGCGTALGAIQFMEGHHRQTRATGIHCPGNAVALCHLCHHGPEGHGSPQRARSLGRIISKFVEHPCELPVFINSWGWVRLHCDGTIAQA